MLDRFGSHYILKHLKNFPKMKLNLQLIFTKILFAFQVDPALKNEKKEYNFNRCWRTWHFCIDVIEATNKYKIIGLVDKKKKIILK